MTRYGHDVFLVWDAEDAASDLYMRVGITLARALCVRTQKKSQRVDFSEMDEAILEIEKRAGALDDIETWANGIKSNSEKILKKIGSTRKSLEKQVEVLREQTAAVKETVALQDEP